MKLMLYLIEIPHQTTTLRTNRAMESSCILSKFHIKPQPARRTRSRLMSCILSKFHIKPQRLGRELHTAHCCILSKFHIKPQLSLIFVNGSIVVSYRNSTSNHNVGPHID